MIILLELRTALFLLLLVLALAVCAGIWWRHKYLTPGHITQTLPNTIFDLAPVGILLFRTSEDCHYVNAAAHRLLELPTTPFALTNPDGASWMALLRHDVLEILHSPNSRGSTRQLTLPSIRRIQWEIQRYAEGCVVFVTDVNVTWQVRQTYHAFVNSLAHELRTPLTSILAHSDLLDDAEIPPSGREASRKVIQRETRRLMRLIQGAVELIRLEMTTDLTQQPIDLVVLAEGAVAQMIPLAEQREIELSFRVATPLPRTLGDADQLMRVFVNVLDNAVKYSRPGDRVDVVLSRNETGIVCAISDTGPGIATEHLPFVCQRLYRGRHDMDGSGLGLALAQEILHKHQSSLDIQSQTDGPTTGTTVRFVLMPAVDS